MANVRLISEEEVAPAAPPVAPPQPQPMPQIYAALASVITGRLHALLLLLSAIAVGLIAVIDPSQPRLYAAAGYGVFVLLALGVLLRKA